MIGVSDGVGEAPVSSAPPSHISMKTTRKTERAPVTQTAALPLSPTPADTLRL